MLGANLHRWRLAVILLVVVPALFAQDNGRQAARLARLIPPPDIDEKIPSVRSDVPCPLPKLVEETGRRAAELVTNLQQFSARDRIESVEEHKKGQAILLAGSFNYVAEIKHFATGPSVEEYRQSTSPASSSEMHWADSGTAAFALIFHPRYLPDYNVTCEGLGELQGKPAWQIRFAQHPDRGNAFHVYRVASGIYPVRLKGRAWIAPDNFQVLRLETDLLQAVDQIRLQREHSIVEYGPVGFKKHDVQLWLPQTSELFIDYRGRRYDVRHTFSHFELFWVETEHKVKEPAPTD